MSCEYIFNPSPAAVLPEELPYIGMPCTLGMGPSSDGLYHIKFGDGHTSAAWLNELEAVHEHA